MILKLGNGDFIFGRHEEGFSVEVGVARSTGLWYYQLRSVNSSGVWSNVVFNDNCETFEEAFEKAKTSIDILQLPMNVPIGYFDGEVSHLKREKFEPINWEEELA